MMWKVLLGISTVILIGVLSVMLWSHRPSDGMAPIVPAQLDTLDPEISSAVRAQLRSIEQTADDASARAELALLYHANSMFHPAAGMYQQVVALDPADARSWYRLALTQYELGEVDDAFDSCRRAIELAPDYAPARRRLGHWLLEQSRFDAAEQQFNAAQQVEPDNPLNDVGLATVQLRRQQYEQAMQTLNTVVAEHSELRHAYRLLGEALHGLGRTDDARRCIAHAAGATLPTDDPWAQPLKTRRLGYAGRLKEANRLLATGEVDAAVALLERLQQDHPDDPTVLNNLASAYGKRGEHGRMIELLERSVAQDPDRFSSHLNLSIAYENAGDLNKALEHARCAAELNTNVGQTHFQLGRVNMIAGQYDQAEAALADAIRHGQATLVARRMLGQAQAMQGRFEAARDTFETLTRLYPASVDGQLWLAEVCARLERFDQAQAALDAARSLNAPEARVAAVQQTVNRLRDAAGSAPASGIDYNESDGTTP